MSSDDPHKHDEPRPSHQDIGKLSGAQKIAAILHNLEAYPFYELGFDSQKRRYVPQRVGFEQFCNGVKAYYFGLDEKNQKTLSRYTTDADIFKKSGVRQASQKFINMLTLIEVLKKPDGKPSKRTLPAGLEALGEIKLFIREQERLELEVREALQSKEEEVPESKRLNLERDIEDTYIRKEKHELAADGMDEFEKSIYQIAQELGVKIRPQKKRRDSGDWGRWE